MTAISTVSLAVDPTCALPTSQARGNDLETWCLILLQSRFVARLIIVCALVVHERNMWQISADAKSQLEKCGQAGWPGLGMVGTMWHYNPILDAKSDTPVFLQISQSIAADIVRGRLQPRYNLPGSRKLARQLGINRNTVLAAYDALVSEGWVVTRPAGGTYVADTMPQTERCARTHHPAPRKNGL